MYYTWFNRLKTGQWESLESSLEGKTPLSNEFSPAELWASYRRGWLSPAQVISLVGTSGLEMIGNWAGDLAIEKKERPFGGSEVLAEAH